MGQMASPGRLILMGSGEFAPPLVRVHRHGLTAAGADRVLVLDSPFGFQENASQLTDKITGFFRTSLAVEADVVSYRHPDDGTAARERLAAQVGSARYVFAGPGSPSYALSRWREADLGDALRRVLADGGTVTLASAAALTAGQRTIPVYEIYKVGADPYWLEGLDLTASFGLSMVVVPHWNNGEGGDHDTSRCFIGARRFRRLAQELEVGVMGIDEHTAAIIDLGAGKMTVEGVGGVDISGRRSRRLEQGDAIGLDELSEMVGQVTPVQPPASPLPPSIRSAIAAGDADGLLTALLDLPGSDHHRALRAALVETVEAARTGLVDRRTLLAGFVELALDARSEARAGGEYDRADRIRERLLELGVSIRDTGEGTEWELQMEAPRHAP